MASNFRPGFNIERLVHENEKYAAAAEYDGSLKKVARNCEWHEKQFRSGGGSVMKGVPADYATQVAQLDIKDPAVLELKMASTAMQKERKAKLRKLIEAEQLQYESELNAMGLAISHDRV
mmetsp:Transcript_12722/g.41955  ORF Transcript_12722/g.41955 Transcript_12722/m.41955 type:complete len:120 (+) Transcript_12722:149-508(+)